MPMVIVTGAARGVGRAVLLQFAAKRLPVVALDKSPLAEERCVDVSDEDQVGNLFEEIDYGLRHASEAILINCAGVVRDENIITSSLDDWRGAVDSNLTSVFLMCREFAKRRLGKPGAIVNVSSVNAKMASSKRVGYVAAKGGIEALTRSLAVQLAPAIRVNCVSLGKIDTRMQYNRSTRNCVLERPGSADEAASSIYFLASEQASYVTGTVLDVDGGYGLV